MRRFQRPLDRRSTALKYAANEIGELKAFDVTISHLGVSPKIVTRTLVLYFVDKPKESLIHYPRFSSKVFCVP